MFLLCFWAMLKDADNNSSEVGQDIIWTLFAGEPMRFPSGLALLLLSLCLCSVTLCFGLHLLFAY